MRPVNGVQPSQPHDESPKIFVSYRLELSDTIEPTECKPQLNTHGYDPKAFVLFQVAALAEVKKIYG